MANKKEKKTNKTIRVQAKRAFAIRVDGMGTIIARRGDKVNLDSSAITALGKRFVKKIK